MPGQQNTTGELDPYNAPNGWFALVRFIRIQFSTLSTLSLPASVYNSKFELLAASL